MAINEATLNQLMGRAVADFGAAWSAPLMLLGEKLGLFKALADGGPQRSDELADRTGTTERYVREWLRAQAAGGYVTYHPEDDRYSLTAEQAFLLADENSPAYIVPGFQSPLAMQAVLPQLAEAFRTGEGIGWHAHDDALFTGTERFFRNGYTAHLTADWIPALEGVEARLQQGGRIADVGCGHGASTIIMAQAFPKATFVGFDYHAQSVAVARQRAEAAGVADRVRFEVASATQFEGGPYDLVTMFDCLHDMGDPAGAAARVRARLAPGGTWMIVEPYAGDRVEDNLTPVGRIFYSASTMVCTPCSLDQDAGVALGAQAGEARIREVVLQGGFTRFRRAAETPFNLIFEAKP